MEEGSSQAYDFSISLCILINKHKEICIFFSKIDNVGTLDSYMVNLEYSVPLFN